jgi:predicted nucleic acid-binding protein
MYLIDTNVFLEVLLERENYSDCKDFLEKVQNGDVTAYQTVFSLHTIAIILERLLGLDAYKEFLETVLNFEGISFYSTNPQDEVKVCEAAKEQGLDFDDALHYHICKKFDLKLVSLDRDFDKTDIKRVAPGDV